MLENDNFILSLVGRDFKFVSNSDFEMIVKYA
jgi:hypothetical protein